MYTLSNRLMLIFNRVDKTGEYIDMHVLPEEYGGKGTKADHKFDVTSYLEADTYLNSDENKITAIPKLYS